MNTAQHSYPWKHWISTNFLSAQCLQELKTVNHHRLQPITGKRLGHNRLFVDQNNASDYPHLYQLWIDLQDGGSLQKHFSNHTGIDYRGLFPRVEIISDIGDFYLEPHHDRLEKRLTALVYTDYQQLWPATVLGKDHRIEVSDNLCLFFVPSTETMHHYPATHFHCVRRALQINYWTYNHPS